MRNTRQTIIARMILAVLLLGALVYLVFRLVGHYDSSHDKVTKTKQPTISKQKAVKKPQAAKPSTPQATNKTPVATSPPAATTPAPTTKPSTPAPAPTPTPTTPPTPTGTAPATGKDLTNSGPGDVAALFAGTVIVSTLLRRRFMLSRATSQNQ